MIRTYFPVQDASIYEDYAWKNTGHDEIIEFGKSSAEPSASIRSIIQFNTLSISQSIASGELPLSSTFELKLNVARSENIQIGQSIHIMMISGSWSEGSGYFYQNVNVPFMSASSTYPQPTVGYVELDGTTWNSSNSGTLWDTPGADIISANGITSQSIADPIVPLTFDMTDFIRNEISGSTNSGWIIKFPDVDEQNVSYAGNVKCFSRQTHTIHSPILSAKWNSQIYTIDPSGSADLSQVLVTPINVAKKYTSGDMIRVKLSVRDQYPLKTFAETFTSYNSDQFLPQTSYFSIIDVQSNSIVIPFGDSSLINCNGTDNYLDFYIEGMYPGRIYKIVIKTTDGTFIRHFDTGHTFTIEQI